MSSLRVCNVLMAELNAILSALHVAWQRNVSKLWIETDSAMSLDLISKPLLATHHYAPLLRRIQQFQQKQWHLRITHTYREGNCVAD